MIRTRFAPSPTGFLHIGGLRTAAYAYALAKHSQGKFLLRIEDTDQRREVKGAAEGIFNTLKIFGINWDEKPVIQSDRVKEGVYQSAARKLLDSGHAFYCQCQARNAKQDGYSQSPRDPCRDKHLTFGAVKLRVPDGETISFRDFVINKEINWKSKDVPDAVLLKSDLFPTYHLAVVVDDTAMQISHVIRAVEWLPSTPIHILVYRYLGYRVPEIGHPTDILDQTGGKLSKRKGNVACEQYLADGYLPEALLNFVILLGWAPKDNREMFTLQEFTAAFDPGGFQKSNPVFHTEKLDWFNGQYIRRKLDTELIQLVKPFMKTGIKDTKLMQIVPLIRERLVKLSDFDNLTNFFFVQPVPDPSLFSDKKSTIQHLTSAIRHISSITDWSRESIESGWTDDIKANNWKVGDYFMSLRIAVCGSKFTPPIVDTMLVLGKDETLDRITSAINRLS
jgi:glutamyl-tRNA synthetase